MSRKRNHRMSPALRQRQQRGQTLFIHPRDLMDLNTPLSPAEVARLMVPLKAAHVKLMDGTADKRDITVLGNRIDITAIRLDDLREQIENHDAVRAALDRAGEAVKEAVRIHQAHGRYGLTGPGRHALQDAVEAYEAILGVSSPRQMAAAEEALARVLETT